MHCPKCGHQQSSDKIRFCTKCGLEMSNVKDLLAPELRELKSKRKSEINKARRQGMIMVFSGFVLIAILAVLRDFFTVPKSLFAVISLIVICGGGLRMALPSLFGGNNLTESKNDSLEYNLETDKLSDEQFFDKSLPQAEYRPPVNFGKQNFDTNELVSPSSVTENTTKLLKKQLEQE